MAGILSARAPPTNAYSHNYRPSFPRNFHIQSIDHTAELQRTVITLSRDNKELNDRNEQLRRQLMDIGTKVRPYQPRRRGPEGGGRPPSIPNVTIVPRDVRNDHDRRSRTGLGNVTGFFMTLMICMPK